MKTNLLIAIAALIIVSCNISSKQEGIYVKNFDELSNAIAQAKPGDKIVLANGIWKDTPIKFAAKGTKDAPITLKAETAGEVFIEGESYLHLAGEYLVADGLYFRNGHTPLNSIISFKIDEEATAFYSTITNCVIENFTKPSRLTNDHWIEFYGKHNTLDHCYISGKSNDGETIRIFQNGNKNSSNYHQITNNYFGPRPRKGGPRAETIRIGDSKTHMTSGFVNVSNNYFEACNGEVETISDKTNFNIFKKNIFYKCEGSLVLRHGSFATVDGNIFIGGDESNFYGGVRVVNTGHWITNNYFYKINGSAFRSPLAVMNGIPKSQLNRYRQVTDAVIAYNTWIDCNEPWQICVGQNMKSANVLPEVEIRSAPPIRSIIANNIIYNHKSDTAPVKNYHSVDGILFSNNVLDNNNLEFTKFNALKHQQIKMKQINNWLFAPEDNQTGLINEVYNGYDFDKIKNDLFESSRTKQNYVGAISQLATAENFKIDKKIYGPKWFSTEKKITQPNIIKVTSKEGELAEAISKAINGDIIELSDDLYAINSSIIIQKEITIRSKGKNKAQLVFNGKENSPVFKMNPKGIIKLNNVSLKGKNNQLAFAPLEKNMSSAYNLFIDNCEIEDFGFVLKAYKGSFSDSISVSNTTIKNCENGFILAAEDKGDYNAEMVTFNNCEFINVKQNVVNFFRGGYDESTIGGFLTMTNNTFTTCGKKEKSGVLIKTTGIINVHILDNTFKNNPIKYTAVLWGEKNNYHSNNTLIKSGEIKVEDQQKLEILY